MIDTLTRHHVENILLLLGEMSVIFIGAAAVVGGDDEQGIVFHCLIGLHGVINLTDVTIQSGNRFSLGIAVIAGGVPRGIRRVKMNKHQIG